MSRSVADKKHLDLVASLGCIICRRPAQIHHPRDGMGMSQRAPDSEAIPLCADHHTDGGLGVAIHAGQATFEERFGTETELLEKTRLALIEKDEVERGWLRVFKPKDMEISL